MSIKWGIRQAAGYGLCLSVEEMSKIGLLCLKKGVFNNKRIVSEKWLEESITVRVHCGAKFRDMKYGYFKPTVFDRIDFIKEQIEGKIY
ncbi:MAG: hypothetical protein HFI84_05535 [Eubacterium sp.]|nr:hypothetical protein [Eubacterium sp.]